jgi:hypothetical protein
MVLDSLCLPKEALMNHEQITKLADLLGVSENDKSQIQAFVDKKKMSCARVYLIMGLQRRLMSGVLTDGDLKKAYTKVGLDPVNADEVRRCIPDFPQPDP